MKKLCPLCKSFKTKLLSKVTRENKGRVFRCRECKHVFLYLGFKGIKLKSFLDRFYKNDTQRKKYIENLQAYLDRIKIDNVRRFLICQKFLNSEQKVLDFGAGYCLFSHLIKPFVAKITVLDKSKLTKENATKLGLKYLSDINELKGERFNLIFAFHTIEHLIDPQQVLSRLVDLLEEKGLMIIEVPNHNDLLVKLSKKYRSFYYQVAHLHYFRPRTLKEISAKAGLLLKEVIPTQRYGLSNHLRWIFGWKIKEKPCLELFYKFILSHTIWRDTLFYIFRKSD